MEQRYQDSANRQREILDAMAARKKPHGDAYTEIVYRTSAAIACIWQVKGSPNFEAILDYLDYIAECVVIAGCMKVMGLMGKEQQDVWDEFESDVLAVSRQIYVQGADDEVV